MSRNYGKLHLIIGPMFSGKTSKLVSIFHKLRAYDESVCIVNYALDKRYSDKDQMSTHDNVHLDCIMVSELKSMLLNTEIMDKYNVFLINEGQFFNDLYDTVLHMVETLNKTVYIAALDGDYMRNGFKTIMQLIPLSDTIDKLTAVCKKCLDGTPAMFSKRIVNSEDRIYIGSDKDYVSVCRKCYHDSHLYLKKSA